MSIDERGLKTLIEESEDSHADSMRETHARLDDMVEAGHERRAAGPEDPDEVALYRERRAGLFGDAMSGTGLVLGAGMAAGLWAMLSSAASADASQDVAAAQTAASLENLAIAVYNKAAGLPFMGTIPSPAGDTVKAFVTKTIAQHTDHMKAFNAAATKLGGKAQTAIDQVVYDSVVTPALPTLQAPLDVVKFAAELELVAAATYAAETAAVTDKNLRSTFASIAGVENQHRAILLAVAALLSGGAPELIKLGPPTDKLPAAAGSVGFPDSFLKTDAARPATEGAVK